MNSGLTGAHPAAQPDCLPLLSAQRKILVALSIAVGISIVVGALAYESVSRMREDAAWVARGQETLAALEAVLSTATDVETASRGFAITGRDSYLQPYVEAVGRINSELVRLHELTAGNASQQQRAQSLVGLLDRRIRLADELIEARRTRGPEAAREFVLSDRGKRIHDEIRGVVKEMSGAERTLLADRQARTDRVSAVSLRIVAAASVLAVAVVVAAQLIIRRDFTWIRRAGESVREANATLESRVAERTAELARLNQNITTAFRDLRLLVEQAPLAIAMFDRDMRYIATSRRWILEYGRGRDELLGLSHYEVHPDLPEAWKQVHRRGLSGEVINQEEDMWVQADGSKHWLRWVVAPWRNDKAEIGGIIIFAEDITQRKRAEERLRLADVVFRNTQEGIVLTDLAGRILAVNPAFSSVTDYSEAELIGRPMSLLQSQRHDQQFYRDMWDCILATGSWRGEVWDRRKSGEIFQQWVTISAVKDEAGKPTHYVGVFTDLSRMNHAQSHLEYLAYHDALTGLPNRALLNARLSHTIERARREGTKCALLLVDLDGFKAVNDTMGHEAGDEVLQLAGQRIRARLRDIDTPARVGGDEFAVVLEGPVSRADVAQLAQALLEQLGAPFGLSSGRSAGIGGSIGIGLFPDDGADVESLMRGADTALYRAKAGGRGTSRFATERAG